MLLKQNKKGFTLIELLVVIAIIGVLTAVLLVNLVGIRERGADTKKKSDLNQLKSAMRLYYNDYQSYPGGSGGVLNGCTDGASACAQVGGSSLTNTSGTVLMKEVPEYVEYSVDVDGETFYIGVTLTNASDPDAAVSGTSCGVSGGGTPGVFYVCTD